MSETILEIKSLSKAFGPVQALRGVNFDLRRGEIHALAGENGAGKSTLMNIIDGILQPDAGEIWLDGQKVRIASPSVAQRLGIGLVHQEIALCPDISVAENIFMAATNRSRAFLMDYAALYRRAAEVLGELGQIDPRAKVGSLSISQQQIVEIAKALTLDCRILILDEPTAALTEPEAQVLFRIMHRLAAKGIAIIYISHRMVEIFTHCDRVTVFRDGCHIRTLPITETTPEDLVNSMVGRVMASLYPEKQSAAERSDNIILSVRGLTDRRRFHDISFDLMQGEILGFAGLIGSGRSEIMRGLCRLEGRASGEVRLAGQPLTLRHYADSIRAGIVYLSEDRKGDGVFLNLPIAANIAALDPRRVANRAGIIDAGREKRLAETLGLSLNLKCGSVADPVSSLSGGNQQKVALAKMLSVNPKLIILDEPTRGVDVGAKAEIHRSLRQLARDGVGIIVISSELPELIGISDRVLTVREGRITGALTGADISEEQIMQLAAIRSTAAAD